MRLLVFLSLAVSLALDAVDKKEIKKLLVNTVLCTAHSGITIIDAQTGEKLLSYNDEKMFTPASCTKIVTTAAALHSLGPDFQIRTSVYRSGEINNGMLDGDLIIYGRGDGSLSDDSFQKLACQCKNAGISKVRGSLIIDSSYFDGKMLNDQWEIGDVYANKFAVEVTALSCNRNRFNLAKENSLEEIGRLFKNCLLKEGIVVDSVKQSTYDLSCCIEVAFLHSLSLSEIVKKTNKESNNFFAELLLNIVGAHQKNIKGTTFEKGKKFIEQFLHLVDSSIHYYIGDGSGLSRYTLFSPSSFAKILFFISKQPYARFFLSSLPVAGVDGTLASRFCSSPGYNNVCAKTGTLSHVSSLSGYATTRSGRSIIFSMLVDNCLGVDASCMETAKACRDAIDAVITYCLEQL